MRFAREQYFIVVIFMRAYFIAVDCNGGEREDARVHTQVLQISSYSIFIDTIFTQILFFTTADQLIFIDIIFSQIP